MTPLLMPSGGKGIKTVRSLFNKLHLDTELLSTSFQHTSRCKELVNILFIQLFMATVIKCIPDYIPMVPIGSGAKNC